MDEELKAIRLALDEARKDRNWAIVDILLGDLKKIEDRIIYEGGLPFIFKAGSDKLTKRVLSYAIENGIERTVDLLMRQDQMRMPREFFYERLRELSIDGFQDLLGQIPHGKYVARQRGHL